MTDMYTLWKYRYEKRTLSCTQASACTRGNEESDSGGPVSDQESRIISFFKFVLH